jgi:hypothetical protein
VTWPQPCVHPYRDSHLMSCAAARSAKIWKPCLVSTVSQSTAAASDTTNRAASTGSSERK